MRLARVIGVVSLALTCGAPVALAKDGIGAWSRKSVLEITWQDPGVGQPQDTRLVIDFHTDFMQRTRVWPKFIPARKDLRIGDSEMTAEERSFTKLYDKSVDQYQNLLLSVVDCADQRSKSRVDDTFGLVQCSGDQAHALLSAIHDARETDKTAPHPSLRIFSKLGGITVNAANREILFSTAVLNPIAIAFVKCHYNQNPPIVVRTGLRSAADDELNGTCDVQTFHPEEFPH